jgi:uncharacterized membrane protein YfhO
MSTKPTLIYHGSKEKYFIAFILGFSCIFLSLLPLIIADGGYFVYYGDYNAQQIPFYILANNAVRNGQLGWNWFTDLGTDFLTSYSFYLTGSPFFWFTTLLPKALITISMPFLLSVKHGLASMTAYAYIRRFVRSKDAAVVGGLLYAFSGFQIYNIFFNHFQDVTAFFPLMLIAMEENINNERKGVFALTTALMSIINYFFFTGQVVFLIIYFLLRLPCSDFKCTWKKFFCLALEAIFGTMIGAFMLLPSALAIIGNYRVTEYLYGQDMILYSDKTRIARIIQTFFMPSDSPARPNLFSSNNAKWSSIGGYLPLFSMTGVIAFMQSKKKHWSSKLIVVCIICAFIPILNSSFYALNGAYYARWFYMPILIMSMMTAYTLDDENSEPSGGVKICAGMLTAFTIIAVLPDKDSEGNIVFFSLPSSIEYFGITLVIAALSLAVAVYLFHRKKQGLPFMKYTVFLTAAASFICTISAVLYGASTPSAAKSYINSTVKGSDIVYEDVSEDNFFRIDISENYDNYPMAWGLPSMRAFQSVVESSIMEFYDAVGITRDVASRADLSHYTLRGLFSVKYYYENEEIEVEENNNSTSIIEEKLPGFEYVEDRGSFKVYENTLYIPMGFGYDTYISQEMADSKEESIREKIMMNSIILTDEQIEKYGDILTPASYSEITGLTTDDYVNFCKEKQQNCSSSFTYDSYGFESVITLDTPQLVFFSVPYSSGWTAEVNGEPVDVEKVSYGFMAVAADAGENVITFKYTTPGLRIGFIITFTGIIGLGIYLVLNRIFSKKNKKNTDMHHTHFYDYTSFEKNGASANYSQSVIEHMK